MSDGEIWGSFWDHLEDLRHTFLRISGIVCIGFVICLYFYEPLFHILTSSLSRPPQLNHLTKQIVQRERIFNSTHQPLTYMLPLSASSVFLSEGTQQTQPSVFRLNPGHYLEYDQAIMNPRLLILSPLEGFLMTFKICFWTSFALTSPFWAYAAFQFIMPGLRQEEKLVVLPFLVSSFICLGAGGLFAYQVTIPLTNHFLMDFNAEIGQNLWSLTHYVDYTIVLLLGHAIAFEICLILLFLVHFRLISNEWLIAKRRYMIVSAFIMGGILTPPDILTQIILALSLIIIYEIAIFYGRFRKDTLVERIT